jgi:tRNA-modifying protein YgfZ
MSFDLLDLLTQQGAQVSATTDARTIYKHFGDPEQEIKALNESAVVCPLPGHVCLRVTGSDRARFLHNFCTNNVNDLSPGQFCEAFFCDVKAKILAHGYVLAGDEFHEIQMLPGDGEALLKHLDRYVITEDVALTSVTAGRTTFVVAGPATTDVLNAMAGAKVLSDSGCCLNDDVALLLTKWNDLPTAFVSVNNDAAVETWNQLTAVSTASGEVAFHHLRILEGYPIIGTDLTSNYLAPEADRNSIAISYAKGCYLGQEPIARLDAMGHVNRKLFKGWATTADDSESDDQLPIVTSRSMAAGDSFPVLLPLPVKLVAESTPLIAKIHAGPTVHIDRLV